MELKEMSVENLDRYALLFRDVFNGEPWYDRWTVDTARERLRQFMGTGQFFGICAQEEGELLGLICGQREVYYDGPRFCIQEFCVDHHRQGTGCGKKLLEALSERLKAEEIHYLYLMTQRGERTQGYYLRRGFETDEDLILMHREV